MIPKVPGESGSRLQNLNVDLGHVNLLVELRRKLGLLQQFGIHTGCHFCENRGCGKDETW